MCEAMRRLMKDEIQQELEAAEKEGEKKGKQEMSLSLFNMGMPIEKIAEAAEVSVQMVRKWLNAGVNVTQP